MPPGLHGEDLNGLSEFKSRPLQITLGSGNPGNLVARINLSGENLVMGTGNHKILTRRYVTSFRHFIEQSAATK